MGKLKYAEQIRGKSHCSICHRRTNIRLDRQKSKYWWNLHKFKRPQGVCFYMEHRQLKYFLKAQELLSFTEAAQQLHISQSTLSQQIKQLETELHTPLFNRIGRQVSLTEAGRLFTDYAKQAVKKAEEGLQMIRELHDMHVGTVTVGVAYSLRPYFSKALIQFCSQYPDIQVKVCYDASHSLLDRLTRFEVDFIFTFHEDAPVPHLIYQQLFSAPIVLIAAKASPLARKKHMLLKDICSLPLAIATTGYSGNHIISKTLAQKGLTPQFAIEVNDMPTVIDLVKTGNWYSIVVGTSAIEKDLVSIPFDDKSLVRMVNIISLKEAYETRAVKAFKQLLSSL